jgi:hypothetical protein
LVRAGWQMKRSNSPCEYVSANPEIVRGLRETLKPLRETVSCHREIDKPIREIVRRLAEIVKPLPESFKSLAEMFRALPETHRTSSLSTNKKSPPIIRPKGILKSATCTRGGNRTRTMLPSLDFESSASTNSATRALVCFSQCGAKINQKS